MTTLSTSERLKCLDWRDLPSERVAPLYRAEVERWMSTLDWETKDSWAEVESGRQLGTVGGVVLLDEREAVVGWSFFLVHKRTLQVGGFIAPSVAGAQTMLDAILTDQVLSSVEAVTFFAFTEASGFGPALRAKGLSVDRYWYLGREIQRVAPPRLDDVRRWRPDDARSTAELLARSYPAKDEARPFAPGGTSEEWSEYVGQLTSGRGCGVVLPDACFCISGGPSRLLGVALVTRLGDNTGHLAQLAIDPQAQRRRLGRRLLDLVCVAAAQAGCGRLTLFVGARNSSARSLYETTQFEVMASFLSAGTLQPRRSTSVAPGRPIITRR